MKNLSVLTGVVLAASLGASAQIPCIPAMEEFEPQQVAVTYTPGVKSGMPRRLAPGQAAPASIAGKNFVTYYGSFTNYGQRAGSIMVEADGDSVLLKGIAMGYDLKGKYDPATGMLTIPTGKPVGTLSSGAVVSVYNLLRSTEWKNYNSEPVVATVTDNLITFADGFYGTSSAGGGYVWMDDIKARPANGMMQISRLNTSLAPTTSYSYPVLVEKSGTTQVQVQGMAQWLYSHNYSVPFNLNKTTNVATLPTNSCLVDYYKSGDEVQDMLMLYRKDSTVNSVSTNPTFDVVNGEKSSLNGKWIYFVGYKNSTGGYRGWTLGNFKIEADLNFYDAPIANLDTIDGVIYSYNPGVGTATVTGASAECTDAAIKGHFTIGGIDYTTTAIGDNAFKNNKTVTKINIPATLQKIGATPFTGASNLKNVNIEDLEAWCGVTIPSYVATPFYVAFPSTVANWGKVTFGGKEFDGTLVIPASIKKINPYTFSYLRCTKKIVLHDSITSLGDRCFAYNDSLQSVNLPESLQSMQAAFYYCSSLPAIDVPRSLEVLGAHSFYYCRKLTDVKLHTGLKEIGMYAFYNCTALTELTLPPTLDTIGASAFNSDKAITSLTCRATVPPAVAADNIFSSFAATCTLSVPEASISAYKTATGWKNFTNVQINTGVSGLETDAADVPAEYYNLQGIRVANPTSGIYIEKRGNRTRKVILKN